MRGAERDSIFSGLANAGHQPELPLEILLPDTGKLRIERWLRVLPGRRYVGAALWNDDRGTERKVLAKLFVGAKPERDFLREKNGALLLAAQNLDTPSLLAGFFLKKAGGYLLFDYFDDSQSLGERLLKQEFSAGRDARQSPILDDALRLIARSHAVGLWQDDLHLDNLLYWQERLYLVDGGGVRAETPGKPLSISRTLENLGVFFAQLPSGFEDSLKKFLDVYISVNPLPLYSHLAALREAIIRAKRSRIRDLMKKTGRDCGLFSVKKDGPFAMSGFCVVRRDEEDALARILENPDAFIARGHIYKTGGTATVARVEDGGRVFIVKRYNIKHFWHWLSRFWRPSRAWTSWREGNRLMALGIPTAKPLAMIERRRFWLLGLAFLITEYLDGQDIMTRFCGNSFGSEDMPEPLEAALEAELTALEELFAVLRRERVSHGDFKGNNLVWRGKGDSGSWSLIDLDAMRAHRCPSGFARAYTRDRERFLRNWPPDSPLSRLLEKHIPVRADGGD